MFYVKITRHPRSKSNNWFGFIQSALNEWILLTSILRIRFLKVITTIILGLRVEYYTRILLQYNRYDDVMCYSTVCVMKWSLLPSFVVAVHRAQWR